MGTVFVGEGYSGKVKAIDLATNAVAGSTALADSMGTAAFSITDLVADESRGWIYAACHAANSIGVVDAWSGAATSLLPAIAGFGQRPIGLAINAAGTRLYATTRGPLGLIGPGNPLEIIEVTGESFPPTLTKIAEVPVGRHPIGVVLSHDERYAVVSCRDEASIVVVDLLTNSIGFEHLFASPLAEPEGLALHPTQDVVYCTLHGDNAIAILDLAALAIAGTVPIPIGMPPPPRPSGGMFSPDGGLFIALGQTSNRLYRFDTSDPLSPFFLPPAVGCGGLQPHQVVFVSPTLAYFPNTSNTQPNGTVAYVGTDAWSTATALPAVFHGPLGMVHLPEPATSAAQHAPIGAALQALPNPARDRVTFRWDARHAPTAIALHDGSGRALSRWPLKEGQLELTVDLRELPAGAYHASAFGRDGRALMHARLVRLQP